MPNLNEFSYDGAAGEFVEIRVDAGASVEGLTLEVYGKDGPNVSLVQTISVDSVSPTTDGTYDYYVISIPLEDGPRAAIALVDNGELVEAVAWGTTSPASVSGGTLEGTTLTTIGDPLKNNSSDSLITDGNGGWIPAPPTQGEQNVCLTSGTLIRMASGELPVEDLKVGMQVAAYGGGARTIRWIGRRQFDGNALRKQQTLRPVRIIAGALGCGLPKQDLLVSRQHRLLVRSKIAERMFSAPEVLVAAIKLTEIPGVFIDESVESVVYYHLLFDEHEVIFANGTPTESLFTGPEAMKALSAEAREEILAIFPEVLHLNYRPRPAKYIPSNRLQRRFVERHVKNEKPVLS